MVKISNIFSSLLNDQNKLNKKQMYKSLYKSFYIFLNVGCIICGFIPSLMSFKRIFYLEDTVFFLIFYITVLSVFLIDMFVFTLLSIKFCVFKKNWYSFAISFTYLLFAGLLSLMACLFTDFILTDTGYEVPFNPIMYIIDLLIILPLYGVYDYFMIRYFYTKL